MPICHAPNISTSISSMHHPTSLTIYRSFDGRCLFSSTTKIRCFSYLWVFMKYYNKYHFSGQTLLNFLNSMLLPKITQKSYFSLFDFLHRDILLCFLFFLCIFDFDFKWEGKITKMPLAYQFGRTNSTWPDQTRGLSSVSLLTCSLLSLSAVDTPLRLWPALPLVWKLRLPELVFPFPIIYRIYMEIPI
jgi:hypothetical protein